LHRPFGIQSSAGTPAGFNESWSTSIIDRRVRFDDDAPQTVDQYSKDIAAFLMWTVEPHLVARKRIDFQVMIFLIVLTSLLYFTKKKVWTVLN
jgi:ubiquinol-cytochrome c reductase cytochrome c1 subunit